jgi:hypothetical protein
VTKTYTASQIGEDERLEAVELVESHGFSADDVWQVTVDDDGNMTVYQYERDSEGMIYMTRGEDCNDTTHYGAACGCVIAELPPVTVRL